MEDPTELEIKLTGNPEVNPLSRAFFIPAVGYATVYLYPIPGIGQVAVVATAAAGAVVGTYILGKGIIKAGYWAYNRIRTHVNSRPKPKSKSTASYNYQKSVAFRDFKDKFGKAPSGLGGKSDKRYKNGRYDVQQDKTQHKGRYKLNKDGKRVGTVDGDGTLVGK